MKPILTYFYFLLLVIAISSCKKFLNVRPDSVSGINPRTVNDFEQMLNNSALATPDYLLADLFSDDVILSDKALTAGAKNSFYVNGYLWDDIVWTSLDNDYMYNDTYRSILQMNIIIDNIKQADSGTVERKEIANAQARTNRAYYYLQLVNLYGTDYQPATAGKDLAIPLVLHPDGSLLPKRNTVQEVYDQILTDLNEAVNTASLPEIFSAKVDVIHPVKASAFAMLARTYLYMGKYEQALAAAESALKIRSTLLDYKTFSFTNPADPSQGIKNKPMSLKDQESNPEILFARVCMDAGFYKRFTETPYISNDLKNMMGPKDLRFKFGFLLKPLEMQASYPTYSNDGVISMQFNYSLGVPEMMLIKAECLARKGEDANALSVVNELRKYRYSTADYTSLSSTGTTDVLTLVLQERRRELFFKGGLRLFDLKRLNREAKFKIDLERRSLADGSIKATLKAGSPRYLMPFAPKIIANNRSMIQNER